MYCFIVGGVLVICVILSAYLAIPSIYISQDDIMHTLVPISYFHPPNITGSRKLEVF